ncbi:hypothetical protein PNW00_09355, partial [Ruminococcus bicirculans]
YFFIKFIIPQKRLLSYPFKGGCSLFLLRVFLQRQLQRTAKPTAFCEIYRVFGKGVVKSGILKIRGCSGRKQRKAKDLRGVVR